MTEFASIACVVFAVIALTCLGLCLFRAVRARRAGNSPWGCCRETGGPKGVTGR